MNRRSSEGTEMRVSRSNSRMIMVLPAPQTSQHSLPRSSTDSAIDEVQKRTRKKELIDTNIEDDDVELEPLVNLERVSVLPFLFLGQKETLGDNKFLCENKIYVIANLTTKRLGPWLRCTCDPRETCSHSIQELFFPIHSNTALIEYMKYFQVFNQTISEMRGSNKKTLIYSNNTQLNLMFATQFMMSHYRNIEFRRAKHQIEKNLRGSIEFGPMFQKILEHFERFIVEKGTQARKSRASIHEEPSFSNSSITRSSSSAHSTPKGELERSDSLPRNPKLAWQ